MDERLDFYTVSKRMTDPKYQDKDCSKEQVLTVSKPISSFFQSHSTSSTGGSKHGCVKAEEEIGRVDCSIKKQKIVK